jgi:LuxR family transcriptional regulator, maltose regulon positive regulatory protein
MRSVSGPPPGKGSMLGGTQQQFLAWAIEKRQLLLVPLDQESHWYRYHPLLAEYLTQRLESTTAAALL